LTIKALFSSGDRNAFRFCKPPVNLEGPSADVRIGRAVKDALSLTTDSWDLDFAIVILAGSNCSINPRETDYSSFAVSGQSSPRKNALSEFARRLSATRARL
jgi:hypothetical protein